MAKYEELKYAVAQVIKNNGNEEITGDVLQNTLLAIINSVGEHSGFAGIAKPTDNPGMPDQNLFYIATEPGTYVNFNFAVVEDEALILEWRGEWVVHATGLATVASLKKKLDIAEFNKYFEFVDFGSYVAIRAKKGVFSDSFISGKGSNPESGEGGGGGGATSLSQLSDVKITLPQIGDFLTFDGADWINIPRSSIMPDLTGYATQSWVKQQGYATVAALTEHAADGTIHITATERTLWNKTATDLATIIGADSDDIINKWEEVVAFLDTYTEADTLANLMSNKADKTTKVIAGTGLTGGGALTGNVTLSLASRTLWGQTYDGSKNVSGDMTDVGSISMNGRIYFGDDAHYIELSSDGYFHFSHGISSEGFISGKGSNPEAGGGGGGGATALSQLTDVSLTPLAEGQLFMYNGSKWTNVAQSTIVPTLKNLTFGSKTYNGTTAQTITAADLGALTAHQTLYSLAFQAGAFSAKAYTPNVGTQTINIPTKTSHLTNDSGFATKLGVLGTQIGAYVNGVLGNLITVPYATNADKVDGYDALRLQRDIYTYLTGTNVADSTTDPNTLTGGTGISGFRFYDTKFYASATAGAKRTQIAYPYNKLTNIQYRVYSTEWSAWKTIANIDDNVASATKLQTARTIWGQSFDGTKNIGGDFLMDKDSHNRRVRIAKETANIYYTAGINGEWAEGLRLQNNAETTNLSSLGFYGTGDTLLYIYIGGTYASPKMVIDASGKVGIGTKTPANILDVGGTISANGEARFSNGAYVDPAVGVSCAMKITHKLAVGGDVYMATLSGNVGIGTKSPGYKLDVNGDARVTGNFRLNGSYLFLKHYEATEGIYFATDKNGDLSISKHSNYAFSGSIGKIVYVSGNIGIGTSTPAHKLDVTGVIHSTTGIFTDGYLSGKGQNTASDARLKTYMENVALTVQDIANAPAWRYKWKTDGKVDVGSTTQYWGRLIPELTHKLPGSEYNGLDYGKTALLSAITIARTVRNHEERIEALERRTNA